MPVLGARMASFRICSNCYGVQVYPYMGFMTGQRYQCQECEEIFVMPIEFETTEEYLAFLKVQSPKKFAELKAVLEKKNPVEEDEDAGESN